MAGATPSHNEAAARVKINGQLADLGLDVLPVPSIKSSMQLAQLVTGIVGDLNLTRDQRERLSAGRKVNLTDEQGHKLTERLEKGVAING